MLSTQLCFDKRLYFKHAVVTGIENIDNVRLKVRSFTV